MKNKITRKTFLLFLLCAGLMTILTNCKKSNMLFHADGSMSGSGILDGAVFYEGTLPPIGLVTYMDGTQQVTDSAFIGQVIVSFDLSVSEKDAVGFITEKGGSILEKIPNAGDYLVQVPQGQESYFIYAMNSNSSVYLAIPHVPGYYCSSGVTVIDKCGYDHGNRVQATLTQCGASLGGCVYDGLQINNNNDNTTVPIRTRKGIFYAAAGTFLNHNNATLINISSAGRDRNNWKNLIKTVLDPVIKMGKNNPKLIENLVITISAGNNKIDVTTLLTDIRNSSPEYKDILSNNVLIVGAKGIGCSTFPSPNQNSGSNFINASATNESDFVYMTSCTAPDGAPGTSYSSPQALCLIQKIMDQTLSANNALQVLKKAALNNSHIVSQTQVLDLAGYYAPTGSPCGVQTVSGGVGVTTTKHNMGKTPGSVTISYDMYGVPDQMDVYYNGNLVASTGGPVSNKGSLTFPYNYSTTTLSPQCIKIVVTGTNANTAWVYTVNCPQ